ncbi:butyrophilin subfamily 1 member A1-like [Halichoeres trimaculatus]|uniref:butyrophilin subfamily 1 member A1-like n=1 Tax=Halichoeres trimaculatus TaxID=147232 RepID=UPI003D9F8D80
MKTTRNLPNLDTTESADIPLSSRNTLAPDCSLHGAKEQVFDAADEPQVHRSRRESQGVGSSETVVALVGDDVVLPCHLQPAVDAVSQSVEWGRPDLEPRFVHVWHDGQNLLENQNPSFKGRTSVSAEKLRRGDLSLTLSAVRHSDNGMYRCYFPSQEKESTVQLLVGSSSPPLISGISKDTSGVVLQCESKGWFPEPELQWLDDKGKVLSAGPKETDKGPEDLFTVRSRLTLEESHDETFTCRVHQRKINQTRETHIQISGDLFSSCFCYSHG